MIRVESLDKANKENKISINLPDKGLIAFIGQFNSGNNSLLEAIAGIASYDGEIEYDGRIYSEDELTIYKRCNIGYIHENDNLFLDQTVAENIRINLEAKGISAKEKEDSIIANVLEKLKLSPYRNRIAGELSSLLLIKLSIAISLAKDAKIIIATNPGGTLATENRIIIMELLKELALDRLVLISLAEPKLAIKYSNSYYEMKCGKIINHTIIANDSLADYNDKLAEEGLNNEAGSSNNHYFHSLGRSLSHINKAIAFYIGLFIIGIFIAASVLKIADSLSFDAREYSLDPSYTLLAGDDEEYNSVLKKYVYMNKLNNINSTQKYVFNILNEDNNPIDSIVSATILYDNNNSSKLIYGRAPAKGECVLSRAIADYLVKGSYEKLASINLMGKRVAEAYDLELRISGVYDNPYPMIYISASDYAREANSASHLEIYDLVFRSYELEKSLSNYKIYIGEDLGEHYHNSKMVLASKDISIELQNKLNKEGYQIIGFYELVNMPTQPNEVIINQDSLPFVPDTNNIYTYEDGSSYLISGRLPSSNNEVLASVYSAYKINDVVKIAGYQYKVVGMCNAPLIYEDILFTKEMAYVNNRNAKLCFKYLPEIEDELRADFNALGITLSLNNYKLNKTSDQRLANTIVIVVQVIVLISLFILMYEINGSKNIINKDNLKASAMIGIKDKEIYTHYLIKSLAITSFTTIIGYLLGSLIFKYNVLVRNTIGMNVRSFSLIGMLLGIVVIYAASALFTIANIGRRMKKLR